MAHSKVFTDGQLAVLIAKRSEGMEYTELAAFLQKQYGLACSADSVRRAFNTYRHLFETAQTVEAIKILKDTARVKRQNSLVAKDNRTILNELNEQDDLLEQIQILIKTIPKARPVAAKTPEKAPDKVDMTVEALLSDVHVGKKTSTFDAEVCRKRVRHFTTVLLQEIARKEAHYNVERVVLAILGDLIENAVMHGKESAAACEFGNPEQITRAIEIIFHEFIVPIAMTRRPVDVVGITGNHDREGEKPTFNDPGKNSFTWIIYSVLKMLSDRSGFANLTWHIPEGISVVLDIYGTAVLYEHADRIKGGDNSRKTYLNHIIKRSAQTGKIIKCLRLGHWHEFSCLDNGLVVVNASVPGQDSYAEVQGYNSQPGQAIVYYVRTKNRDSAFYHAVLIQLP